MVRLNTFVTSLHFGSSVYCEQVYVAELMADAHACAKRNSHNRTFEDINKVLFPMSAMKTKSKVEGPFMTCQQIRMCLAHL